MSRDINYKIKMNNGVEIPQFGLGVYLTNSGTECVNAVTWALEAGYRHIDTARIYGNEKSTLGLTSFGLSQDIFLYPNPSSTYFTINANTSKVEVYSITGQLVKSFKPNQSKDYQFVISELNKGVYFVKALNDNNEVKVMKFVKK